MAYIKILNIKNASHIGNSLDYVEDEEKTNSANRPEMYMTQEGIEVGEENSDIGSAISNLVNYTTNEQKTEERHLVTGFNCTTHNATSEMQSLIDYWKFEHRISGVSRDAFHIIQSFDPSDNPHLTPQAVHEIGKKFCAELERMDDKRAVNRRYMMLLSTHVDKEHLHNHIILCAYDIDTGRKFHECKDVYRQMREASDRLCKEHGLSVIERPDEDRKNSRSEWNNIKSNSSWKDDVRKDIEAMKSVSGNWSDFQSYMESAGYKLRVGKHVTYTTPDGHSVRDSTLGREWTKAVLEREWNPQVPQHHSRQKSDVDISRFYKTDQELQKRAAAKVGDIEVDDSVDGRRTTLAMIFMIAMEMLKESDEFKGEIYFSDMRQANSPEKERNYRVKRMDEALKLAKDAHIRTEDDLQKQLDACGVMLSRCRKELNKNKTLMNKMQTIANALDGRDAVKDVAIRVAEYPDGDVKASLQTKYQNEIEQYKRNMAVLYRFKCATPAQEADFRVRYSKVQANIESLSQQVEQAKEEYKDLLKIKDGLKLARDEGFLSGKFYDNPATTRADDREAEQGQVQEETRKEETTAKENRTR